MPIRPEVNGKLGSLKAAYVSPEGTAQKVKKIYAETGGKLVRYWSAKGNKDNPYLISVPEDLKNIAADPGGCYIVQNDLTFDDAHPFANYFPLLPPDVPFTGILDGQGHKFLTGSKSVTVSSALSSTPGLGVYFGIFFYENRGIVTRINLEDNRFSPITYGSVRICGYLVGLNTGTIDQSAVYAGKKPNDSRTWGGICGQNQGTIQNCANLCLKDRTSGIAAINEGTIRNSYVYNTETYYKGIDQSMGLFAFENRATGVIKNCFAAGIEYDYTRWPPAVTNEGQISGMYDMAHRLNAGKFEDMVWRADAYTASLLYNKVIY